MRALIETLVVFLIVGLVAHQLLLAGLFMPVVVAGSSMAPTLVGSHYDIVCRACGLRFACDRDWPPPDGNAICPNCYSADNPVDGFPARRGARLVIDRAAWTIFSPKRWRPYVLRDPDDARNWLVKRLIGLPGERVEIRAGDVWIDGPRACKSLATLRSLAILVDDDSHRAPETPLAERSGEDPRSATPSDGGKGWRPARKDSPWHRDQRGWQASDIGPPEPNWLVYHHLQAPRAIGLPPTPGPVLDDNPYEQAESRLLRPARDLMASFRVRHSTGANWLARIDDGRDAFEICWDTAHDECRLARLLLERGDRRGDERGDDASQPEAGKARAPAMIEDAAAAGEALVRAPLPQPLRAGTIIEFAQCDGRILVAVNHEPLIEYAYSVHETDRPPSATPLAIAAQPSEAAEGDARAGTSSPACSASIDELRVLRDIYYLAAPEAASESASSGDAVPARVPNEWRPGPRACFFLGDNTAWSQDSRVWPAGAGQQSRLIGPLLHAPWARHR